MLELVAFVFARFFAGDLLAALAVVVRFLAGDFFAGDFFAGDFFAGDFFAGDFLTTFFVLLVALFDGDLALAVDALDGDLAGGKTQMS